MMPATTPTPSSEVDKKVQELEGLLEAEKDTCQLMIDGAKAEIEANTRLLAKGKLRKQELQAAKTEIATLMTRSAASDSKVKEISKELDEARKANNILSEQYAQLERHTQDLQERERLRLLSGLLDYITRDVERGALRDEEDIG